MVNRTVAKTLTGPVQTVMSVILKLENGSSGQTLIGNMSNNMQLRQALNLADNSHGMTDEKINPSSGRRTPQ